MSDSHASSTLDHPSALATIKDVQERQLGVSRPTIYRLIESGDLVVVRIGRSVRITQKSIDAFIARGGTK